MLIGCSCSAEYLLAECKVISEWLFQMRSPVGPASRTLVRVRSVISPWNEKKQIVDSVSQMEPTLKKNIQL